MSLSPSQLKTHAEKALTAAQGSATLAYAWPHDWTGGEAITLNGRAVPVRQCRSALEIGEVLSEDSAGPKILLVSVPEEQLGAEVLARVARHRLLHINRWEIVQDALGVQFVDPRLYALNWMPEALLSASGQRRGSQGPALTYDDAIELCLRPVLGIAGAIDLDSLVVACETAATSWMTLSVEQQTTYRQYLVTTRGALAGLLVATMESGHGTVAIAIGLACEILYSPSAVSIAELRDARVRLEERLKRQRIAEAQGRQWAELSRRIVLKRAAGANHRDFRLAVDMLESVEAHGFVALGTVLPESLDARLEELAECVAAFLRRAESLPDVIVAGEKVLAHQLAPPDHPGPECARMVVRLCQREAVLANAEPIADPVSEYLAHGAWEDWARRMLRSVRPEKLARAVSRLLDQIAARRLTADTLFGRKLVETLEIGDMPAGVLPIESALSTIVAPLADRQPVLLVVLDGMSQDVYLALASAMTEQGWNAWKPASAPNALLATIPSVTECSRASLFAGRLTRGVASQERQTFSQHLELLRASKGKKPPLLLHKAGLESTHQLTTEATTAIADEDQQVVAVVINAIDDALAKSDQIRIAWTIETIPILAEALEHARRAGRVVVLTSDHGHVLERQSTLQGDGDGERWRTVGARPLIDGEIVVRGPRVESLMGHPVVAPYDERIRYAVKKNGYHGGICAQELLVPFGIWTSDVEPPIPPDRYEPSLRPPPSWWLGEAVPAVGRPATSPVPARRTKQPAAAGADLFTQVMADDWLEPLLRSALLARQLERAGRLALDPERLKGLLGCLQSQGGRASAEQLAASIGQPVLRMRGIVAAMERLLNVDGYLVIGLEQATGTVMLDVPLLRKQFLT